MAYNINTANPLVLAFVGDGYFSYRVREHLAMTTDFKAGMLHTKSKRFVCAEAQSALFERLLTCFSEFEAEIARRALNAHLKNSAKNADFEQYRKATALEAVVGALVLTQNYDRLDQLFGLIFA